MGLSGSVDLGGGGHEPFSCFVKTVKQAGGVVGAAELCTNGFPIRGPPPHLVNYLIRK